MNPLKLFNASFLMLLFLVGCGADSGPATNAGGGWTGAAAHTIGGTVTGLDPGEQMVLTLNGDATHAITVGSNTAFTFSQSVVSNGTYTVAIASTPAGKICSVNNGTGTGLLVNIGNISVTCSTLGYTVSGMVSGLVSGLGAQTTLLLNGDISNPVVQTNDGVFSFSQPIALGATYTVTVGTQPTDLKYCQVSHASGTATAAVNNVTVICSTGSWVMTEIADSTTEFPADPLLDPVNAANGVVRAINDTTHRPGQGYFDVNDNYYFAVYGNKNTIFKIASNGIKTSFSLLSPVRGLSAITGDSQANLYFLDLFYLYKVSSNGNISTVCPSAISSMNLPAGIVYDNIQSVFYITDEGLDTISSLDPTSCGLTTISDAIVFTPKTINIDSSSNLFVAHSDGISQINKLTGAASAAIISSAPTNGNNFVFDAYGNLYMTSRGTDAVAADVNGNLITLKSNISSWGMQGGLARNSNGHLYVSLLSGKIIKLSRP
jgi:hypothetical protein